MPKLWFNSCLGEVISEKYVLEYGTDCLEMHAGAVQPSERVIIIDDLVATGGTLSAAIRLLGDLHLQAFILKITVLFYILFFFQKISLPKWICSCGELVKMYSTLISFELRSWCTSTRVDTWLLTLKDHLPVSFS